MNARAKRTRSIILAHKQLHATHGRQLGSKRFAKGHSGNPGGKRKGQLPKQQHPVRIAITYARQLRAVLSKDKVRAAFAPLLERLPELLRRNAEPTKRDAAGDGPQIRGLVDLARQRLKADVHPKAIADLASNIFDETSTFQREQLSRQVRAAFGVDIFASDQGLADAAADFVEANVALIKGLPDRIADDVEKRVMVGVQTGQTYDDLADDLEGNFGFGETRAKIIARDQIGKAYAAINEDRLTDLGVERYTWRTSEDERVREEHEALDGEVFSFEEGSGAEGNPGDAVLCRCSAEPVFDDLLSDDESDDGGEDLSEDRADALQARIDELAALLAKSNNERRDGDQGPPGERGRDGDPGPIGPTGPAGSAGERGRDGDQGPPGERGRDGDPGPIGPTGPAGMRGDAAEHSGGAVLWGEPGSVEGAEGDLLITPICTTFRRIGGIWISTSLAGAGGGGSGTPGPKGDTGATGTAGPTGATGPAGATGATGAAGSTGATGSTGPAGANGFDGLNGATWSSGAFVPSAGLGVNGDFYFHTTSNNVYLKTAGTWSVIANLTGAGGSTGPTGPTGATGPAGPAPSGTGFVHVTGGVLDTPHELTGDVTAGATGVTTIAAHAVTVGKLAQAAGKSLLGVTGGSTADIAAIVASGNNQFPLTAGGSLAFADFPTQVATLAPRGRYGDGSDGVLNFDGTSTITLGNNGLTIVPSAGVYTLPRDIFPSTMSVSSAVTIKGAGFWIWSKVSITGADATSIISCDGGNGGNGTTVGGAAGAAAWTSGRFNNSGLAGGAGGTTSAGGLGSTNNSAPNPSPIGGAGLTNGGSATKANGGGGGGQGGSAGSVGGGNNPLAANAGSYKYYEALVQGRSGSGNAFVLTGCSGGGGGGQASLGGGGGGGGGGNIGMFTPIVFGTLVVQANGGNGGNGNASGITGGGGGGGGGYAILDCMVGASNVTLRALAGTHGLKGTTGVNGGDGFAGITIPL